MFCAVTPDVDMALEVCEFSIGHAVSAVEDSTVRGWFSFVWNSHFQHKQLKNRNLHKEKQFAQSFVQAKGPPSMLKYSLQKYETTEPLGASKCFEPQCRDL